jgi:hypothetical protein
MERFWEKVDIKGDDECWEWLASKRRNGYGQLMRKGKNEVAHRVAYELVYDHIPGEMIVMHTCDNRVCCNPNHLRLGTDLDNIRDMYNKGRGPTVGLREEQVMEIYKDNRFQKVIAAEYGISQSQVSNIKTGKQWFRITEE